MVGFLFSRGSIPANERTRGAGLLVLALVGSVGWALIAAQRLIPVPPRLSCDEGAYARPFLALMPVHHDLASVDVDEKRLAGVWVPAASRLSPLRGGGDTFSFSHRDHDATPLASACLSLKVWATGSHWERLKDWGWGLFGRG